VLVGEPPRDSSWKLSRITGGYKYTSTAGGSVTILENPWHVEFRDAQGRLLTKTHLKSDNVGQLDPVLPFSFIRRTSDYSRSIAAVFSLTPGEKIFGCGESFTRLDKRGQKVVLWTNDANGVETGRMYKPIPFFMSNRGYGIFVHPSAPAPSILAPRPATPPPCCWATMRSTCSCSWVSPRRSSTSTPRSPARHPCRHCGVSACG